MGSTYTLIAKGNDLSLVTDWFSSLPNDIKETSDAAHTLFYFREFGPITNDARTTPLVNCIFPTEEHNVLTTAFQVHFLPKPMKQFPELNKINVAFRKWVRKYELVFSQQPSFKDRFNYYLEGSLRNLAPEIYAFPDGFKALKSGSYFIDQVDIGNTQTLLKQLKLRGVIGINEV